MIDSAFGGAFKGIAGGGLRKLPAPFLFIEGKIMRDEHGDRHPYAPSPHLRGWMWRRLPPEQVAYDGSDGWGLYTPCGSHAATVWDNAVWHTWDRRGIGGENGTPDKFIENDKQTQIRLSMIEAERSVLWQGYFAFARLPKKGLVHATKAVCSAGSSR